MLPADKPQTPPEQLYVAIVDWGQVAPIIGTLEEVRQELEELEVHELDNTTVYKVGESIKVRRQVEFIGEEES